MQSSKEDRQPVTDTNSNFLVPRSQWLALNPKWAQRPPDYRLQLAAHLAAGTAIPEDWVDPGVDRAYALVAARRFGLGLNTPPPAEDQAALQLLEQGPLWKKTEVEARLLAAEPVEVIAAKTGVPAAVVAAYEHLCFAVTDRLQNKGYIIHLAIRLHDVGAEADLGVQLKAYGFFGGAEVFDFVFPLLIQNGQVRPGGVASIGPEDGISALHIKSALLARATIVTPENAVQVALALAPTLNSANSQRDNGAGKLSIDVHIDPSLLVAQAPAVAATTTSAVEEAA